MVKRHAFLYIAILLFLLAAPLPAETMMQGGHGHMHGSAGGQSAEQQEQGEAVQQTGHRHGEYYHSHEGGELPHSHYEKGSVSQGPQTEAVPSDEPMEQAGQGSSSERGTSETAVKPAESTSTKTEKEAGVDKSQKVVERMASQSVLEWRDDMILHLVPAPAEALSQRDRGKDMAPFVEHSFYMDETPVTNHQYVEFLNKVLDKIEVDGGVVKNDGNIWLLLGEVKDGYEPIVYLDGRFQVNGVHHAACAVLRVTAYGAEAYAQLYGKRLPTETEWLYAVAVGEAESEELPIPSPVVLYAPDKDGIRGLNSNIGEWAVRVEESSSGGNGQVEFVVLRGPVHPLQQTKGSDPGIRRYPWEGFAEVGFRTVLDVSDAVKQ